MCVGVCVCVTRSRDNVHVPLLARYAIAPLSKVIDTFVAHSASRLEAVEELTGCIEVMLSMHDDDGSHYDTHTHVPVFILLLVLLFSSSLFLLLLLFCLLFVEDVIQLVLHPYACCA